MLIFYLDNIAAHYRKAIFMKMDQTFNMEFLFGKKWGDVKEMDTSLLRGIVQKTETRHFRGGWYWQSGLISKLSKHYDRYLLVFETRALSTWVFCLLAQFIGKRKLLFFWSHGWYGKETYLEKITKKILFRLAGGGIFLYGNYARDLMIKEGFNPEKLFVIHNSLDYERHLEIRCQLQPTSIYVSHFNNIAPNLVFIGRLTKIKRLDLVLGAMRLCKEKGLLLNMTFVGDGAELFPLQQLTYQLGLNNQVWFYGACYDETVNANLIFNADLCIAPGNVGLTAIHAMTFGTPVITHNDYTHQMPEFEAIQDGITGSFFTSGDMESLANTISHWLLSHVDRELVRQACYDEIGNQWNPQFQIDVLLKYLKTI